MTEGRKELWLQRQLVRKLHNFMPNEEAVNGTCVRLFPLALCIIFLDRHGGFRRATKMAEVLFKARG